MGKLSRGIGAGLVKFGESVSELSAERRRNERVDARLEKEDAFKERELSIREDESALRQKAMERQGRMDESKFRHANLVQSLSAAGDNQTAQAAAYSKWFPDKRQYTVNREKAINMENGDGDNPYMVWDVSYNATNESGQMIPDPTTGKTKQLDGPNGPKVFWTKDEYTNFVANTLNPDVFTALAMQALTDKQAYTTAFNNEKARLDAQAGAQEAFSKTPAGIAQLKGVAAKTKNEIASANLKNRTDPNVRSGSNNTNKQQSKMRNLPGHEDGDTSNLTTKEMEQRKDDAKAWRDKIEGITAQEVRYIEQGNAKFPGVVDKMAQDIVNNGNEKEDYSAAVNTIVKNYRVSTTTARGMLRIAVEGKESNKPGFFGSLSNSLFGKNTPTDEQF